MQHNWIERLEAQLSLLWFSPPQPTTTISASCLPDVCLHERRIAELKKVPWLNSRDKDAGGLRAWSTVTICLFLYINITISCSKHGMCARELSSLSTFLGKHFIHCNKLLQLCHPAIQLLTSSLVSQLSLCLKKKNKSKKQNAPRTGTITLHGWKA